MVERNMCNAVMRGTVIPPGSKSTSRANGLRRNLGYPTSGRRLRVRSRVRRSASGRRGAVADDARAWEVGRGHSSCEAGEQGRAICCGVGGAKGRGQRECAPSSMLRTLCRVQHLPAQSPIAPARAAITYQSALNSGVDLGDYVLSNNDFIGAAFSLSVPTIITDIGGQFGCCNGVSIFGTIVPLAFISSFPSVPFNQLASVSLADIVFAVPSGTASLDLVDPLSTLLRIHDGRATMAIARGDEGWKRDNKVASSLPRSAIACCIELEITAPSTSNHTRYTDAPI